MPLVSVTPNDKVSLENLLSNIESIEPNALEEIIEKNPDLQNQLVKLLTVQQKTNRKLTESLE